MDKRTTEELREIKRRIRACWKRLPATDPRLCWLWDAVKEELKRRGEV